MIQKAYLKKSSWKNILCVKRMEMAEFRWPERGWRWKHHH